MDPFVVIFLVLGANFLFRILMKGYVHFELLKHLELVESQHSFFASIFTLSVYKFPTLTIPYIERIEHLDEKGDKLYLNVKKQIRQFWISLLLLIIYFVLLVLFY